MTSLIHHGLPPLIETQKDASPQTVSVEGAAVSHAELVRALLRHGSFDRYYFTCDAEDTLDAASERLIAYGGGDRAQVIPVERVEELRHHEQMILLKNSLLVVELCALRRWSGRASWPIAGLTHSLSYLKNAGFALFSLAWLLEDIRSHDCLVCTTRSAEQVYRKMIAGAVEYLSTRLGVSVMPAAQTAVIPLGIDTGRYRALDRAQARATLGIPLDRFVVLSLGRLSPESKADPVPLLLAFRKFSAGCPHARLVLAGDDTRSQGGPQMRKLAGALGIDSHIDIVPNLTFEQKIQYYSAADVFISLSDNVQETFGLTVVEAMSMGLPVVTSAWDGYKETVVDGETGCLIPTSWLDAADDLGRFAVLRQDPYTHRQLSYTVSVDIDAVAAALKTLADNPGLRRRLGENARRRAVREYDWSVVVRAYEALWLELLARGRNAADSEPGFGVSGYDYRHVFGHYASELNASDVTVRVMAMAPEWLPIVSSREQRLWGALLRLCGSDDEQPLDRIAARLREETGVHQTAAARFLARCVKYGAVRVTAGVQAATVSLRATR
jgi:D-inositol-3-phosphate glycosyltransferase